MIVFCAQICLDFQPNFSDVTTVPCGTATVESDDASIDIPGIYPTLESSAAQELHASEMVYPVLESQADKGVEQLTNLEEEQQDADLAHEEEKVTGISEKNLIVNAITSRAINE